ncbi:MAG: redoxin domain-containing protein [Acidobacteriota bacterium]
MDKWTRRGLLAVAGGTALSAATLPATLNTAAPELTGKPGDWINTDAPLSLRSRLGKVTVVHFWTFACWNCKNNLPIYNRWHAKFGPRDAALIGIHTPELDVERNPANVRAKVKEFGIEHAVLLDNGYANWRRWNQQFWPCVYLVDRKGRIRARWDGEMNYGSLRGEERMNAEIERLLAEPA